MKAKISMITVTLTTVCLLAGAASARNIMDQTSLSLDRQINQIFLPEQHPLNLMSPEMLKPDYSIQRWPEGDPHRNINPDTSPAERIQ